MLAAQSGNLGIVKELCMNGASLVSAAEDGRLPLHYACQKGHTAVVEVLCDNMVLFSDRVNHRDKMGRTPLAYAAQADAVGSVRVLLEMRASVNEADERGVTPLWLAAFSGHLEVRGAGPRGRGRGDGADPGRALYRGTAAAGRRDAAGGEEPPDGQAGG